VFLKKLKLTNYRNYTDFDQSFNHLKTIIVGQNAQGKSNILEAINILATSESDRAEKDNDIVHWNKEYAIIFANIETKDSELEIALQINPTGRRKLKINSVTKKAPQADLVGNFFSVMFSCDDLYLIKGSPSIRRRWLDSILFQLDIKYHRLLVDYQKSVAQKNALLKSAAEKGIPLNKLKAELEIWNEKIINAGSGVINIRLEFIEEIKPIAKKFLLDISKDTEELALVYKSTVSNIHSTSKDLPRLFRESLEEVSVEEYARGQSIIGPHRDDIEFLITGKAAKSFASQGQQRSIVLTLKLAELKIIEQRKDEMPVLLLDDVFAELDESRQDFLLHNLPENIQTFITTTHLSDVQKEFLKSAQLLEVKSGMVEAIHELPLPS